MTPTRLLSAWCRARWLVLGASRPNPTVLPDAIGHPACLELHVMCSLLRRCLALCILLTCALAGWAARAASGPANAAPERPVFQIEGGMHTAPILQMQLDASRQRLVTVSTDHTARIWLLPSMRLSQTIRVPVAEGFEGELMAAAISPDGKVLALGGFTGGHWGRGMCIYLYELATARLKRPICSLPEIVQALAFSPDGKRLAVGLGGRAGLRVLDTATWATSSRDTEYGATVRAVDYARSGLLATTAADGYLRLYDASGRLVGRRKVQSDSRELAGMRFAPDGALIAVGMVDRPQAILFATATLDVVATRQVSEPGLEGLCCVAFSLDGRHLYVNGHYIGPEATPLFRIDDAGLGSVTRMAVGNLDFTDTTPLPDGSVAVATDAPSLGLIDTAGHYRTVVRAPTADFRGGSNAFAANEDGSALSVPMSTGGQEALNFDTRQLASMPRPPVEDLRPAVLSIAGAQLDAANETLSPSLDGRPLPLNRNERVLTHAFAADGQGLVLGTYWSVRRYQRDGTLLWRSVLSAPARNVLVTRDQRFVIATVADGTVRWFSYATGKEVVALFLHTNRRDWVMWRPDGYYASSDEGDQYVGWLASHGVDQEPDFFRAVQFERLFYRPDLVLDALRSEGLTRAVGKVAVPAIGIDRLADIAPPRVRLIRRGPSVAADGSIEATILVVAERLSQPMNEMTLYVNGLPVTPSSQRMLRGTERQRSVRELTVPLPEADNLVRVEITGPRATDAMGLAEAWVAGPQYRPAQPRRGQLHVVAVGVNEFPAMVLPRWTGRDLTLDAAAADATAIAEHLRRNAGQAYEQVHVKLLADQSGAAPDKAHILAAMRALSQAGPHDTTIVFLASHGISDRQGNYYFVPRDAKPADLEKLRDGSDTSGNLPSLLGWAEVFDALRQAAGKRVLIVDTCQARNVAAERMAHSLRKRSASSQFALMLASQGQEDSQELPELGHGVFTYGILEALDGKLGRRVPALITLTDAFDHAADVVQRLRPDKGKPQTPELFAPGRLGDIPLAGFGH